LNEFFLDPSAEDYFGDLIGLGVFGNLVEVESQEREGGCVSIKFKEKTTYLLRAMILALLSLSVLNLIEFKVN
jgi:hypothetical protein